MLGNTVQGAPSGPVILSGPECMEHLCEDFIDVKLFNEQKPKGYKCRCRCFGLTLEKESMDHWQQIWKHYASMKSFKYGLMCMHDGPEFKHIHTFFQFTNPVTINTEKLWYCHVEDHIHHQRKYVEYCKALDEKHIEAKVQSQVLMESGEMSLWGGNHVQASDLKNMTVEEIREVMPVNLQKMAIQIREEDIAEEEFFSDVQKIFDEQDLCKPVVNYFTGESRSGKTYAAYKDAQENGYSARDCIRVSFDKNGFAHTSGHTGSRKVLIIEEFRSEKVLYDDFLSMCDNYGFKINVKGSDLYVRPERINICSVLPLAKQYDNENSYDTQEQLFKRVTRYIRCEFDGTNRTRTDIPKEMWHSKI